MFVFRIETYPVPCDTFAQTHLQGRSSHKWKTRWFALGETCLGYYKKAERARPLGVILLDGACVISPVKGYEKRQVRETIASEGAHRVHTSGFVSAFSRATPRQDSSTLKNLTVCASWRAHSE